MKKSKNEIRVSFIDPNYPLFVFIVCLIVTILLTRQHPLELENPFNYVLSATITWSSVLLGFIGVLLGVLFNLLHTDLIKTLFKYATRNALKRYFSEALISGVLLILLSMVLFICDHQILLSLWVSTVVFKLLCAYRIISLMMYILFSPKDSYKNEDVEMNQGDRENLYKLVKQKGNSDQA